MNTQDLGGAVASQTYLASKGIDVAHLVPMYTDPARTYHNLDHIDYMCRHINEMAKLYNISTIAHIKALTAAWYHDAIYVPGSTHNESASGELFFNTIGKPQLVSDEDLAEIYDAILCTRSHQNPETMIDAIIIDADLAVLGINPQAYRHTSDLVKAEYPGITDAQWRDGRREFLASYLARETIYFTSWGAKLEGQARSNMEAERLFLSGLETM